MKRSTLFTQFAQFLATATLAIAFTFNPSAAIAGGKVRFVTPDPEVPTTIAAADPTNGSTASTADPQIPVAKAANASATTNVEGRTTFLGTDGEEGYLYGVARTIGFKDRNFFGAGWEQAWFAGHDEHTTNPFIDLRSRLVASSDLDQNFAVEAALGPRLRANLGQLYCNIPVMGGVELEQWGGNATEESEFKVNPVISAAVECFPLEIPIFGRAQFDAYPGDRLRASGGVGSYGILWHVWLSGMMEDREEDETFTLLTAELGYHVNFLRGPVMAFYEYNRLERDTEADPYVDTVNIIGAGFNARLAPQLEAQFRGGVALVNGEDFSVNPSAKSDDAEPMVRGTLVYVLP